ncbi:50S ribosomal protein L3 [Candidatus Pacearchaeota archaeon]|nr:50S ribosomal protein L3 [Candidatus Pacearchaeota archaeon]
MSTRKSPRKGSLQFWPRKRASKFLPRVNWNAIDSQKPLKGFICYKAGMVSAQVKDNTPDSMTKGKKIIVPATILECPPIKIFSIRFYKYKKVTKDILASGLDKELKRKVKLPKKQAEIKFTEEDCEKVSLICYSVVKKTGLKKKPDLFELGLSGTNKEKMDFINQNLNKEISVLDVFEKGQLLDVRGLTKGKGLCGPVKRFGITLKSHKSEKGRRRPGSLGPWHPARVTFMVPQAGQLGMFTRVVYNNKIIDLGNSKDKEFKNIKNYGNIKTDYIIVRGSVQGSAKRQLIITAPLRETKKQKKKELELVELR